MAVHVALSVEAQVEARALMMSTNNILSPAHGKPIIVPTQDIVLGLYFMTREKLGAKGEGKLFASFDEVRIAYDQREVELQARMKVRVPAMAGGNGGLVDSTVGRVLLYEIVPHEIPFAEVNKVMKKKELGWLIDLAYRRAGNKATVIFADRLKDLGYEQTTYAGISIGIKDMVIPAGKHKLLDEAHTAVREIEDQYNKGLITDGERYNKVVDIWAEVTDQIADEMLRELGTQEVPDQDGKVRRIPSFNPIFMMADSGARGSAQQIRQLAGMRGLMAKPSGEIIETPITANFREGLTVLQYFISTHGARKGLADTALKTANSGYLTRRLVDVAQDSIIEPGTQLTMRTFHIGGTASRRAEQTTLEARNEGFIKFINLAAVEGKDGDLIVMSKRNGEVAIVDYPEPNRERERERYPLVYGAKLKKRDGAKVKSADLIAEWDPYTIPILTESAGVVKFGDILEGVTMEEKLDERTGLSTKVIVDTKDVDKRPRVSIKDPSGQTARIGTGEARYLLPVGAHLNVVEGQTVAAGDVIAKMPRETTKTKDITEIDGIVSFGKDTKGKRKVVVTPEVGEAREYLIPKGKHISVHEGDYVKAGEALMDGSSNPHDILTILGEKALAKYLVDEVQEIYRLQGVRINDKHIEVIVRQMLRRVRIKEVGDTDFLICDQVEKWRFEEENERVLGEGGQPAVAEPLLLGITKASLSTESFISAASFQETTKVLTEAAINGKVDRLVGLKENVIMGRLIPAGTGVAKYARMESITDEPAAAEEVPPAAEVTPEAVA